MIEIFSKFSKTTGSRPSTCIHKDRYTIRKTKLEWFEVKKKKKQGLSVAHFAVLDFDLKSGKGLRVVILQSLWVQKRDKEIGCSAASRDVATSAGAGGHVQTGKMRDVRQDFFQEKLTPLTLHALTQNLVQGGSI
jgi:hypothetical protein